MCIHIDAQRIVVSRHFILNKLAVIFCGSGKLLTVIEEG